MDADVYTWRDRGEPREIDIQPEGPTLPDVDETSSAVDLLVSTACMWIGVQVLPCAKREEPVPYRCSDGSRKQTEH